MSEFQVLVLVVSLSYIAFTVAVVITLDLIARKRIRGILEARITYTREDFERRLGLWSETMKATKDLEPRTFMNTETGEIRTEWVRKRPKAAQNAESRPK